MKILEKVKTISENQYSKHFIFEKINVDLSILKAYDEDSQKHYVVANIKNIPELDVSEIQYPFEFENELDRDEFFNNFDAPECFDSIKELIKKQIEEAKEKEKNTKRFVLDEKKVDLYIIKEFDENFKMYNVLVNIDLIQELQISDVKYPYSFENELERDEFFDNFDAHKIYEEIYEMIKKDINE